jgi:hypothetical protein
MANRKISQLTGTTTTTVNDYFIKNNSGETETNKVQVKNAIGLTNGSGANSIKSASFLTAVPADVSGLNAVGIGNDCEARADYSTALGFRAEVFDSIREYGTAIGANTRVAQYSTHIGSGGSAVGAECFAGGYNTQVSGSRAVGLGYDNRAQGSPSVAIGDRVTASANFSIGIGSSLNASAASAICIGDQNTASAVGAVAIGNNVDSTHINAVGLNVDTSFSSTTHTNHIFTKGSRGIQASSKSGNITIDGEDTNIGRTTTTLASNISVTFTNLRDGFTYEIFFSSSSFDVTSVVSTGLTQRYSGGSQLSISGSTRARWECIRVGTQLYINQTLY